MLRLQKTTKKFCQIKKNDYLCTRKQGNIVGALDEWLSQRSAKPSTAVRIRQAPQRKVLKPQNGFQDFFASSQLPTKKKKPLLSLMLIIAMMFMLRSCVPS